jgi:hypothetical protein
MVTLHGRPYVFGGYENGDGPHISSTVLSFVANTWVAVTHMEMALMQHSAVALDQDTAVVYADAV